MRSVVSICWILLFKKDGTIADATGFLSSVEKGFPRIGYEKLCGIMSLSCSEARLRCIAGKRLMAYRNNPSIVHFLYILIYHKVTIDVREICRIGRVVMQKGSTSCGCPSIRVLDFPLWLVKSEGSVLGNDSLVEC